MTTPNRNVSSMLTKNTEFDETTALGGATDSAVTPTRPAKIGRQGRRLRPQKDIVRFTLDLGFQQHYFLRSFALEHGIEAAKVCRELLLQLETDPILAEAVLDGLFGIEEDLPEGTPAQ